MKKKHKERKRGNKTGIRSIDDVTISQCVVIRIGKKKRQKLIRLLHVILHRKLRFHGVESGNRNVVGHFIFSFFLSFFFFFLNLFYSIGHELARIPCFLRFFFHFFFFFSIHFKLSFCRPLLRRRDRIRFERFTGCAYIYIYIRSIRTCGVHANRWWRWWPSVFNKLSDRCTCQIAMNQRMLLF